MYFFIFAMAMGASYGLALVLMAYSFTLAPTSVVAPYQYVQIIFAFCFGYFLFGDIPDVYMIIGSFIIIGAGILLFTWERKKSGAARAKHVI